MTSWSRIHCQHLRLSVDDIKILCMLSKFYRGWGGYSCMYLGLDNRRNIQFGSAILHICLMEVIGCIPPFRLRQFVKPHLPVPITLHAVLYCSGDCAHHAARIIIIIQLAELCILFVIFHIFTILLIVTTCKITQTVSYGIQHQFKFCFWLSGCRPRALSSRHNLHLLHNHCLCVLNSLSSHSGFSPRIILDPFLFLLIP